MEKGRYCNSKRKCWLWETISLISRKLTKQRGTREARSITDWRKISRQYPKRKGITQQFLVQQTCSAAAETLRPSLNQGSHRTQALRSKFLYLNKSCPPSNLLKTTFLMRRTLLSSIKLRFRWFWNLSKQLWSWRLRKSSKKSPKWSSIWPNS